MQSIPLRNPPNPWASASVEYLEDVPEVRLQVFLDHTRQILAENDSPDLSFRYSVNPYRGCFHGCAYCYARPTHEYLSMGAGTDFERKIVVKPKAPELLETAFRARSWCGEWIAFSGVTDCYQPLEASYGLTRDCLKVCAAYRNPAAVITKSPLIERDLDVLTELHERTYLRIVISIPLWSEDAARALEPYVTTPARRIRIIKRLADAGLMVGVNVAPFIPGVSDEGLNELLREARRAGARFAGFTLLRLPGSVKQVFEERVREAMPDRADKILAHLRRAHDGKLYQARFGKRMVGQGEYTGSALSLFEATAKRHGLNQEWIGLTETRPPFERPAQAGDQLALW